MYGIFYLRLAKDDGNYICIYIYTYVPYMEHVRTASFFWGTYIRQKIPGVVGQPACVSSEKSPLRGVQDREGQCDRGLPVMLLFFPRDFWPPQTWRPHVVFLWNILGP